MRKGYGDKISDAELRIQYLMEQQAENEKQCNQYSDLSDAVEEIIKNDKLTKELIDKLIDKIYVYKGRRVEIVYKFQNEFTESEVCVNG